MAIKENCVLNFLFEPSFSSIPFDFSSSQIYFTYDNGKTGIISTTNFGIEANLINPARLEIQSPDVDPLNEIWDLGNRFVANDSRFETEKTFVIKNVGDVSANEISLAIAGSPYLSQENDCPAILAKDEECNITVKLNPHKSIYDTTGSLDITTDLTISYKAGDATAVGVPKITNTYISTIGTITNESHLVFSEFDTNTSGSVSAVYGTSGYFLLKVKNIGVTQDNNFSLLFSNSSEFSVVEDPMEVLIDGHKNCGLIDNAGGVLYSGEECIYKLRAYSSSAGSFTTDLNLSFHSGADTSSTYVFSADFVEPAKLAIVSPTPVTKTVVSTYDQFNYPGVGQTTSITDPTLMKIYGEGGLQVDPSKMSFPALPGGEVFDFAFVEGGYLPINSQQQVSLNILNDGAFLSEIRSMQILEVYDLTASSVVTGFNYFSLKLDDNQTCAGGGEVAKLDPGLTCQVILESNITTSNLYRIKANIVYTLGHTVSPTSEDYVTYTSEISYYVQGYDASNYALITAQSPSTVVTNKEISFEEVYGGDDSQAGQVILVNNSSYVATDIHYIVLNNGSVKDILSSSSDITILDMALATSPLDDFYRLASTSCSQSSVDQMVSTETCNLNMTFSPKLEGKKDYLFYYRYFNGITYIEDSFTIKTKGLKRANLDIKNLTGGTPQFFNDFGESVVEEEHAEYVEVKNTGEVDAENVNFTLTQLPFSLGASDDLGKPTCSGTIAASETCYMKLALNGTYAEIDQAREENFNITWDTGVTNSGVPESNGLIITASAFIEEKHSGHQGWTYVDLRGYNLNYANQLIIDGVSKPNGSPYNPEDLGFIRLKWNNMIDIGVHSNTISSYAIFKNTTGQFNIHGDPVYATVPAGGLDEYEFIDNSRDNIPGKVWYYYIAPVRNGHISRVKIDDYPIAILRAAVPHSFSSGLHRYMNAMEVCRLMGKDTTDPTNIDLTNNGCKYLNGTGSNLVYSVNYDLHMDMFEGSSQYANSIATQHVNGSGNDVIMRNFDNAQAICKSKIVSFATADPVLNNFFTKELPLRRDHFLLSQKEDGYVQEDCQIVDGAIETGSMSNCSSDFGLENAAGGLPEWTIAKVDGFGRGASSALNWGGLDTSLIGIDYTYLFNPVATGVNQLSISNVQNKIDNHCFNPITGMFQPQQAGSCSGDHLVGLTTEASLESPTRMYLSATEPANTAFKMLYLGRTISTGSLSIRALAGGGDALDSSTYKNDYSPFTTEFTYNYLDKAGFRCSVRLPY